VAADPVAEEKAIPRFAKNSPFAGEYKPAAQAEGKRLWAGSFLWEQAPELIVEEWLTPEPAMQGRYVLIEHWATWCGPCRRSIPLLNEIHRRFKDRLVVIGISDEPAEAVRTLKEPRIEYPVAIDTQARMKTALAVTGIPHVIILEPRGYVVWEGFPLLQGHELTPEIVERILGADARDGAASEP
jgi:thiol-disulfide isomerase/thioredoxin